jgi:hypothetical protein
MTELCEVVITASDPGPGRQTGQDSRSVPWFAAAILLMRSKSAGGTIALSIREGFPSGSERGHPACPM